VTSVQLPKIHFERQIPSRLISSNYGLATDPETSNNHIGL